MSSENGKRSAEPSTEASVAGTTPEGHGSETDTGAKVLLVEDSESLQRLLGTRLRRSGFVLDQARDGCDAQAFLDAGGYDVVVLDLILPGIGGLELLARMRRGGDAIFVLIISALGRTEDRVRGFDLGADDYLVKPFAVDELLSRLHALRRRDRLFGESVGALLRHDDILIDTDARTASRQGRALSLTPSELALLEALVRDPDHVLTREQLIDQVYPRRRELTPNALEAHVSKLRRKLPLAGAPPLVETRRGAGYGVRRLVEAADTENRGKG